MTRDAFDRHLARDRPGLYESHYLKANSPDGQSAFWIKHNLLVPAGAPGAGVGEFWLVWFERGAAPRVWKREVPLADLTLRAETLGMGGDRFHFDAFGCTGQIAGASWRLAFSGGRAPLFHFASPRLYTAAFPKKKLLTPAPNLRFDGAIDVGGRSHEISSWLGLRGHNWGTEHAFAYAYGNCNQWDDGATDRAIDGFTARIKLGPTLSPWLSSLVFRDGTDELSHNRFRDWLPRGASVSADAWRLPYRDLDLAMTTTPDAYVGLRYRHPGGRESYCYNTKFADVAVTARSRRLTSRNGELEVLFASPLPGVALHPTEGWTQRDGDYHST